MTSWKTRQVKNESQVMKLISVYDPILELIFIIYVGISTAILDANIYMSSDFMFAKKVKWEYRLKLTRNRLLSMISYFFFYTLSHRN